MCAVFRDVLPRTVLLGWAILLAAKEAPASTPASGADKKDAAVEYKPLSVHALQEFGQVMRGKLSEGDEFRYLWIDHMGAWVTQEMIIRQRLTVNIGVGGIFAFQYPQTVNNGFAGSQRKNFYASPSRADAVYAFGDPAASPLQLGLGLFPFKYNPDAANLGEYLFRTGAYPGYIFSGGYSHIDNSSAYLQGFRASSSLGGIRQDLLLVTETGIAPLYDWSLAYLVHAKPGEMLEVGAGIMFSHLISVDEDRTTPPGNLNSFTKPDGTPDTTLTGYTFRGTKLMGRVSLDLKPLFSAGLFGENELRVYMEAAVLGVKDYPGYYPNILERVPVMAGINVPVFKLLDILSLQGEYYASPYINNTSLIGNYAMPHPFQPDPADAYYRDVAKQDNLKWSVFAKKTLFPGLSVMVQAARDHIRTISANHYYGPGLEPQELTLKKSHWYWMAQFSFGL